MPAETNEAANPGTMEAALLDLALLSTCDDMVVTIASSFGWVAGRQEKASPQPRTPMFNPWVHCVFNEFKYVLVVGCSTHQYLRCCSSMIPLTLQRPWAAWHQCRCYMESTRPHRIHISTGGLPLPEWQDLQQPCLKKYASQVLLINVFSESTTQQCGDSSCPAMLCRPLARGLQVISISISIVLHKATMELCFPFLGHALQLFLQAVSKVADLQGNKQRALPLGRQRDDAEIG